MTTALVTALVASWIAIVVLAVVVFALARQVGVLHERLGPVGALSTARRVRPGETAPSFSLASLDGGRVEIGGKAADGRATLVFFLSTTCPVCATLVPVLRSLAKSEADSLRIVIASDGDDDHEAFAKAKGLDAFPYVISTDLGMAFGIGKLPYGVLIDEAGVVAADGLCNTREHIESLLEARAHGVASIQDFKAAKENAGGA